MSKASAEQTSPQQPNAKPIAVKPGRRRSLLVGKERLDFWMLSFGQLLVFCGFFSFFQFPLFIKSLGGGEQRVGLIMGGGTLAATLLLPWVTAMADRIERKSMMLGGLILMMVSTLALITSTSPGWAMAGLMVLRGLGFTIYMNASSNYVAQITPPSEKSQWFGINFGFNQVAIGLGPMLGELAILHIGFPFFFFLATAFSYAGMLLLLGISPRYAPLKAPPFSAMGSLTGFYGHLVGRRFLSPFLVLLFLAGALGSIFNFTALYTQLLGLSSGLFFVTYSFVNAGVRFGGSGIADRYGRGKVVVPTLIMMGVGIFLYSIAEGIPMLITAAILIGIGFGLSNPAILAGMLDRSPPRLQSTAVGIFHYSYNMGLMAAPPLFGGIAEIYGYSPMWWIAGGMVFISLFIYLVPQRPVPGENEA